MIYVESYIHDRPNSEIKVTSEGLNQYRSPSHVARRSPSKSPPSSTPPWTAWEVERDSLRCINQWNQDHQDNKFSTVVLKGVNGLLESQVFEATLAFIPDNPVPAKSLIKALVSLTLLVTVSKPSQQSRYIFQHPVAENSRSKTRSLRLCEGGCDRYQPSRGCLR